MPEFRSPHRVEKINTIEIKNLWGRYHFKWELNDDVNILIGINGSGKTTIFNVIDYFFNDNLSKLKKFKAEVIITYNNNNEELVYHPSDKKKFSLFTNVKKINTFDVFVNTRSRTKTLLDIELEKLIFKKDKSDSFTFLDYRLRKMRGTQTNTDRFEKYQKKINNFYALINDHFKDTYKEIQEDEVTNGVKFYHTKQDKDISIYDLSAGEKQLLIIFFTVFLQDEQPSVLLLDEPEISLHIIWQQKLINTLRELNPNCQLIIATHSPGIFGKGWGYKKFRIEELFYD